MKKSARKILTLTLSLVLIFVLATSVFAAVTDTVDYDEFEVYALGAGVWCNDIKFQTFVGGDGTFALARMVTLQPGAHYFEGTVTLNYTYCPENEMRPSAYRSGTVSRSISSQSGARYIDYFAADGYIMISATGKTFLSQTAYGTTYTTETAPVTISIN